MNTVQAALKYFEIQSEEVRADATPQSFLDLMSSHFKSRASESSDEGFSIDSMVMINVEHCRSDVTNLGLQMRM